MPWKPRSSSFGAYISCDFRAAFDRLIDEGKLDEIPRESSPYADFGTCVHYKLQTSVAAVFPGGNHAPTPEQRAVAGSLHADGKLDEMIDRVAACARAALPVTPDGKPWLAEAEFKLPCVSGHIDFLSSDYRVIGDLKTTSRKPDHNRAKPEHLWQIACYAVGVQAKFKVAPTSAWILYVDSLRGQWAMLVNIDLTSEPMQEMISHVHAYSKYLRGRQLYTMAKPRMGMHCSGGFCPHVSRCKDRFLPPPTTVIEAPSPVATAPAVTPFFKKV
jgi:hypothetical protein